MGNRNALLICNNEYIDAKLHESPAPLVDAEEFALVLGDPEVGAFDTVSLVNQEIQTVRIAIARLCQEKRPEDVNLIYYSGQGVKDMRGRLFLATKDTQLDLLSATGLSGQFILEEMSNSRARSNVVILDCVYAGAVLRNIMVPRNVVILAGADALEYAFESPELNQSQSRPISRFTAGLIEGLSTGDADSNGDGTVTFNELFAYAKSKVELATEGYQNPRIYDLSEERVIAGRAARPIFLSYSRSDSDFASRLGRKLQEAGHKVWMDTEGITGGDDWRERIGAAIDASKLVLTVLSSEALSSIWVRRELSYADKGGKPILPVFYKDHELPAWYELQFGHIQRLDLAGQADAVDREPLLSSVKRAVQYRPGKA
jgi:hypothetical protein